MGVFLAALGDGNGSALDPAAGLLHHAAAFLEDATLAVGLEVEGLVDGAEAVHVLDFGAVAVLFATDRADADVGVAPEAAVLHVAGGDAEVLQERVQGNVR